MSPAALLIGMRRGAVLGLSWMLAAAWSCGMANAREVAGWEVPEIALIGPQQTPAVLNGAGIRTRFFFKIYVGALYLPERAGQAQQVYAMVGPKRVLMHFLYDQVSAKKLTKA